MRNVCNNAISFTRSGSLLVVAKQISPKRDTYTLFDINLDTPPTFNALTLKKPDIELCGNIDTNYLIGGIFDRHSVLKAIEPDGVSLFFQMPDKLHIDTLISIHEAPNGKIQITGGGRRASKNIDQLSLYPECPILQSTMWWCVTERMKRLDFKVMPTENTEDSPADTGYVFV